VLETDAREEPAAPRQELSLVRIAGWQLAQVALLSGMMALLGRGSIQSLAWGAAFLLASMWLTKMAAHAAFRRRTRPGLAVGFFLLKLIGMLGVAFVGLQGAMLGPMSFAAGATTLPMAIVIEACYGIARAGRHPASPS
jgi:hypothetical protein